MLPPDLADWLCDQADRILATPEPWRPRDQLVHEVWLFDTQVQNGGVSQYFGNYPERWPELVRLAAERLPELGPVVAAVERAIAGEPDPYDAILGRDDEVGATYEAHRQAVVEALRTTRGDR